MRKVLVIGLVLCVSSVHAQNLVQNPQFDSDANGWILSTHAGWSNHVDYGDVLDHGSLQISTSSDDDAIQCVELHTNTRYELSFWSEKDPEGSIAPCAKGGRQISLSLFGGAQCSGDRIYERQFAFRIPEPEGWVPGSYDFQTDGVTNSALISLGAACSSPDGLATYYYDDIAIEPDAIFKTDFEIHAPEGGPNQPPGG